MSGVRSRDGASRSDPSPLRDGRSPVPRRVALVLRGAHAPRGRRAKGTAAPAPAAGRDAGGRTPRAAAPGADAIRGRARPGRPPSRRRSRPRATGTSGPRGEHRARAARASMSGAAGNMCSQGMTAVGRTRGERVYVPGVRRANGSAEPISGARALQRKLHARVAREAARGALDAVEAGAGRGGANLSRGDGCYACQALHRRGGWVLVDRRRRPKLMEKFVIEGGVPLSGTMVPAGNKNGALPILAASVLTEDEVLVRNVPRIRDVEAMLEILAGDRRPGQLARAQRGRAVRRRRARGRDRAASSPSRSGRRSCSPARCSRASTAR